MKEFMIDGHKIVAVPHNEEKDNVPVIFIHGLTANVRFWGHVQPSILTDSLKWYAMTLPGHFPAVLPDGFSPMDLTTKMMAETLWGAINELVGDQPVILVGHSTGGFAALALSIYHPEIVKSICSIAGFAQGVCTGSIGLLQKLSRLGGLGESLVKSNLKLLVSSPKIFKASLRFYAGDVKAYYAWPHVDETVEQNYEYAKQGDGDAMVLYFKRLPDIDITDLLSQISAPVTAVTGDNDPIVPPEQSKLIADKVQNGELVVVPGAGHLLPAERPDGYQKLITDWLNKSL